MNCFSETQPTMCFQMYQTLVARCLCRTLPQSVDRRQVGSQRLLNKALYTRAVAAHGDHEGTLRLGRALLHHDLLELHAHTPRQARGRVRSMGSPTLILDGSPRHTHTQFMHRASEHTSPRAFIDARTLRLKCVWLRKTPVSCRSAQMVFWGTGVPTLAK